MRRNHLTEISITGIEILHTSPSVNYCCDPAIGYLYLWVRMTVYMCIYTHALLDRPKESEEESVYRYIEEKNSLAARANKGKFDFPRGE